MVMSIFFSDFMDLCEIHRIHELCVSCHFKERYLRAFAHEKNMIRKLEMGKQEITKCSLNAVLGLHPWSIYAVGEIVVYNFSGVNL